jgi:hypothetical protein
MPYASERQRRFFHSPGAKKAGLSGADVKKWDKASKGMQLPETAKHLKPGNPQHMAKPRASNARRRLTAPQGHKTIYHHRPGAY